MGREWREENEWREMNSGRGVRKEWKEGEGGAEGKERREGGSGKKRTEGKKGMKRNERWGRLADGMEGCGRE